MDAPPSGYLLAHLLRFGRLLRLMGVKTNLSQMLDLVHALHIVPMTNRRDFYFAARALLVTRHEEYELFDQAFQMYWREPLPLGSAGQATRPGEKAKVARLPGLPAGLATLTMETRRWEEADGSPSYSAIATLRQKDFAEMTWEEVEAAKAAIAAMQWPMGRRATRRVKRSTRGHSLDLRRLVRDNLRYGGEPIVLRRLKRKMRPRPIVALCDISGSMERYSRMLLHFLHALSHNMRQVEMFVFGTRLTRITHHMRSRDVDEALDEIGRTVTDWSGGTRIGEAIKSFNFEWARRVLGRGAGVLIISDGWDRGDLEVLAREMGRLQRSAHRLIWLNPLLGSEHYRPIQRGMAAALPYVDDFLPVHNLKSLQQLADVLGNLRSGRPQRKPNPLGRAPS